MTQAVTVFAGARDQYQLAIALAEAGLLHKLVTDMYFPADEGWFQNTVGRVLPIATIEKRYRKELDSTFVQVSKRALMANIAHQFVPSLNTNLYKNRMIGQKARRIAERTGSAVFAYSYYAQEALDDPTLKYRFIFQVHPQSRQVQDLLREEMVNVPAARESLMQEVELGQPEEYDRLVKESSLANGWVVASSFTKQTLLDAGVSYESIHVVPYGVDSSQFPARQSMPDKSKPFTIIFVGQMVQRKGLSYLLDAVRCLDSKHVRVVLCGRGYIDRNLLQQYDDLDMEIHVNLPYSELIRKLQDSHIFVLPSLVEGFGHVILEAMNAGLPVITTPHTCGPDVIVEGEHGFIVPIRSSELIAEKLTWAIDHPQELEEMSAKAREQALSFTWQRFRQGIVNAYQQMLQAVDG